MVLATQKPANITGRGTDGHDTPVARSAAIVGAGVMGLAAARSLARRGWNVTIYEQFEVGHKRGSSHGRSRIFRLAWRITRDPASAEDAVWAVALGSA